MVRLAVAAVLASGCATLFTGTHDTLTFDSNVPGVRLTIDGHYMGELPMTFEMSRNFMGGKEFKARFEMPGYATQEFKLEREFNPTAILDITAPLTSGVIDIATGAMLRFSPTEYHIEMLPAGRAVSQRTLDTIAFALSNYRRLQTEIARGGGEYLETLTSLTGPIASARLDSAMRTRTAHEFARALGLFDG